MVGLLWSGIFLYHWSQVLSLEYCFRTWVVWSPSSNLFYQESLAQSTEPQFTQRQFNLSRLGFIENEAGQIIISRYEGELCQEWRNTWTRFYLHRVEQTKRRRGRLSNFILIRRCGLFFFLHLLFRDSDDTTTQSRYIQKWNWCTHFFCAPARQVTRCMHPIGYWGMPNLPSLRSWSFLARPPEKSGCMKT